MIQRYEPRQMFNVNIIFNKNILITDELLVDILDSVHTNYQKNYRISNLQ